MSARRATRALSATLPLILGGLLVVGASGAQAAEWRVSSGGGEEYTLDDGIFAVSRDRTHGVGMLALERSIRCDVLVGLSIGGMGTGSSEVFGLEAGRVGTFDVGASARWVPALKPWLRPYLHGELGASRAVLRMPGVHDDAWGAVVGGYGGLELRAPPGMGGSSDFTVGVWAELGFRYRTPMSFSEGGAQLGTLDLFGPHWRVGVSFML